MTPDAAARLGALFDRAVSSPPEMRPAIITEAEHESPGLGRELESMLSAHNSADAYFEKLARDVLAPAVVSLSLDDSDAGDALFARLREALAPSYTLERELGGAGMSRVFIATEARLARKVVIKVLPPEMSQGVSVERFRREIQLSARLQHPHIVHVLASDVADGLLYYVMPYVDGETLRARMTRDGALPLSDSLAIWCDLLDALGFAHQHGVVHRDVKPENILLTGRNALIADFGIARALEASVDEKGVTATGVILGTPSYMAPEQVSGEGNTDHRIDLYAAGLVMYEMLEGRTPFAGRGTRDTALAHLTLQPPPLKRTDMPGGLGALILRCLAKKPEERPQNAEMILREIESGLPVTTASSPRNRNVAVVAVAAIFLLVAATYIMRRDVPHDETRAAATPTRADSRASLVVLPLVNRSPDSSDAGLADGMTEVLIGTLSKNPNLRVMGSTSAFAFKGTHQSESQIADSLHVSNILEGSLQRVGMRLRMQLRLVARDGSTRWSQVYDRQMADVFAVEDDISRAVGSELGLQLRRSGDFNTTRRRYTPSIDAYEWYIRGMDITQMRTASGVQRSMEYFQRAIAADPKFAAAYAGLVRIYLQLSSGTKTRDQREWKARAKQAALKAVALDDSLADAHAALGWVRTAEGDYSGAESSFKRAMDLNPAAPRAHEGFARLYMMMGRTSEQLDEARAGVNVDPFSHAAIRELALALNMNGRCDEALKVLKPLKSLTPPAAVAGIVSGQCYEAMGKWSEAIAEYQWALKIGTPAAGWGFLGHALARAGRTDEAKRILSQLLARQKDSKGAFGIAVVYTGLRDYDKAFEWLFKAVDERSVPAYIVEPMFADLHADPRYAEFLRRMRNQNR
jgi:serine/threonine-protein kinase